MFEQKIKYDLNIPSKEALYRNLQTTSLPREGQKYSFSDFKSNGNRGVEIKDFVVTGIERTVLVNTKVKNGKIKVANENITVTIEKK